MHLESHPNKAGKCLLKVETVEESFLLRIIHADHRILAAPMLGIRLGMAHKKPMPQVYTVPSKLVEEMSGVMEQRSAEAYRVTGGWEKLPENQEAIRLMLQAYLAEQALEELVDVEQLANKP